ncbi:MAG: YeeE/YedE thiosulfate transporter family protein [Vitreoscilla sp.]
MDIMIRGLAFIAAASCAALMGFAIQRGATCTVAAVDQVVNQRKATRLVALGEASLWVCAGLLVAHHLHLSMRWPTGHALTVRTLMGAALLGLGAFVNRACVFGAVARFGSGEWAQALTPAGFYLGSLVAALSDAPEATAHFSAGSNLFSASPVTWIVAVAFLWRIVAGFLRGRAALGGLTRDKLWSPHTATSVIGLAFLAMFLLIGSWAYTDALADLAHGMTQGLAGRLLLAACLLAGAVVGGWTAGRLRSQRIGVAAALRCLAGGAMMGWGSLLIPGSNDGLILVGLPMLWPYAWVAFLTMCLSIAAAMWIQKRVEQRWRGAVSAV